MGDKAEPCPTPTAAGNGSESWLSQRIAESMELHDEISLAYELMTCRTLASATVPPKQFWDCQRTPVIRLGSRRKETSPIGRKTMLLSMTTVFSFN